MTVPARLLEVRCAKCGKHLAEVVPGAWVYCRACNWWTRADKKDEPCKDKRFPSCDNWPEEAQKAL